MKSVESCIRDTKIYFKKREYEQFIHPLVMAYEEQHRKMVNQEVNRRLTSLTDSLKVSILENKESINNEDIISISKLEELLQKELRIVIV